jgi:5'-nucleotidase/UDP-sugar diphosphatase
LTILDSNDGRSQLVNLGSGLKDFGGVARFATVVQREKESALSNGSNDGVILVSSGNNFLAGPTFTAGLESGSFYDALALDMIGYDAITLGNHDFDFGPDVLAKFISQVSTSKTPFLSSNLDFSGEPSLQDLVNQGRIAKSVVVEENGQKIGIIGATTPTLRVTSSPRNVRANGDVASDVQAEIDMLENDGVNKIVLVSHLQSVESDMELLSQVNGVDVLVAGGGDKLLANEGDLVLPGDEKPFGPYPMTATDVAGTEVPVVTTSGQYGYLGKLVVTFDSEGNVTSIDKDASGPIRIAGGNNPDAVQPDAQVQQQVVDPVEKFADNLKQHTIATTQVHLDGLKGDVRSIETNEGDLMADSLLWQADRLAPDYNMSSPDVAILNGGGIHNDSVLPTGPIQELDTFDIAPFADLVTVVENVSREQFKEVLENAVSRAVEGDTSGGKGRFAQVAGLRFEWSESGVAQAVEPGGKVAVPGTRVQKVALNDGTVIVDGGDVVPGPALTVATLDFMAQGGDEYPFRDDSFTILGVSYQQALSNYLQDPASLDGTVTAAEYPENGDGRIKRMP